MVREIRVYPLAGITYCAHCERLSRQENNPKLRSALSGRLGIYYRHAPKVACGRQNKSVQRSAYEMQFVKLMDMLEVKPESVDMLLQLATTFATTLDEDQDFEKQKSEGIALCRRRIDAAIELFRDGHMDKDEYRRRVEFNEREIAHWEATTTDSQQLALQLTMCLQVVSNINRLWTVSSDEDRQGMVRHFFDYVVYDLDQQAIVDFRLKAWADQFLYVKTSVMGIENDLLSSHDNSMTPTRYQPSPRYLVIEFRIHRVAAPPRAQVEDSAKIQLREKVLELRGMGMSYPNIASILNISIGTAWNYANRKH